MLVNAGKTLFLGESVKVFLKEISTLIGELRRADSPLQSGWAHVRIKDIKLKK